MTRVSYAPVGTPTPVAKTHFPSWGSVAYACSPNLKYKNQIQLSPAIAQVTLKSNQPLNQHTPAQKDFSFELHHAHSLGNLSADIIGAIGYDLGDSKYAEETDKVYVFYYFFEYPPDQTRDHELELNVALRNGKTFTSTVRAELKAPETDISPPAEATTTPSPEVKADSPT